MTDLKGVMRRFKETKRRHALVEVKIASINILEQSQNIIQHIQQPNNHQTLAANVSANNSYIQVCTCHTSHLDICEYLSHHKFMIQLSYCEVEGRVAELKARRLPSQ